MSIPKGNLNKPTDALVNLMNKFITSSQMTRKKKLNLSIYRQRDTVYFKNLTKDFKSKVLSFFYMNACSFIKNFDNFNILLSELNVSFHILAITETTLKKD